MGSTLGRHDYPVGGSKELALGWGDGEGEGEISDGETSALSLLGMLSSAMVED